MIADPRAFAADWLAAWNAHDVEAVLRHFHDEASFTSPFAARLLQDNALAPSKEGLLRAVREGERGGADVTRFTVREGHGTKKLEKVLVVGLVELVAPGVVITMPQATLRAVADHAVIPAASVRDHYAGA